MSIFQVNFKLQPVPGKVLELAVVDVVSAIEGLNVHDLIVIIRQTAVQQGADVAPFARALSKSGIGGLNARNYDHLKWAVEKISFFDCMPSDFPALRVSKLAKGITSVRYELNVEAIAPFQKTQIDISWS